MSRRVLHVSRTSAGQLDYLRPQSPGQQKNNLKLMRDVFVHVFVRRTKQVVDNSSAFRMTEGVPLIVPEVNPADMAHIKLRKGGAIIANPNCSTIIALMAVTPLHRAAIVKRMVVSTYQVPR